LGYAFTFHPTSQGDEIIPENEILDFIRQAERALTLARDFLAMWRKRTAIEETPAMKPASAIQAPLIPDDEAQNGQAEYGANKRAI